MSSKKNGNSSNQPKAETKNAEVSSKKIELTSEQARAWSEARKAALTIAYGEVSKLDTSKILELAQQRVARLLDEKHNTAALKLSASPESMSLSALLDSKRLSAESKSNTQEAFANLLMSGTLKGESKARALEVFKSGKVAEMAAFLLTQAQVSKA